MTVNPGLRELLETGAFNWENPRHREAYLRAWVKGGLPVKKEEGGGDGRGQPDEPAAV